MKTITYLTAASLIGLALSACAPVALVGAGAVMGFGSASDSTGDSAGGGDRAHTARVVDGQHMAYHWC
jgi:hypothetical protein